ncbi:AAA+ family ATPase [Yoonia sp.]|uniref:AAA+ family ATPase n=1 Tax=Yoonia sp. TaxID=2212373 RepID=UPI0025FED659|nr:AAA+ family ATPase [Yoonia sp.]
MKQFAPLTLAFALLVTPAAAQDSDTEVEDGFGLIEEGAKMLMRGLMSEMAPAISDLRNSLEDKGPIIGEFVHEMGPALTDLLAQVDDLRHYQAPEFLPNGDIILRRKPDAPIWVPQDKPEEIEL